MQKNNDIACVILAGGFGTRLAPLTDIKPKPLVSILDTPVLESILGAVEDLKPSSITVSAHFHSEQIEKLCKDNHRNVVCKKENIPLGTAGGVKFCYDGKSENVLVVSGDAVFDFSLSDAVDFHIKNKSDVTIVACRNENPTRYGTIETDSENNVVAFCEKPSWKKVRSSLVNTGIYLLSRRVLFEIPDNMACDFSNNLFPRLLRERADIKVFEAEGFWCDVGCFSEYASCNKYAADGLLACIPNKGFDVETLLKSGIHAENGVYVSQSAIIGKNVRIADGSVVCEGTHIGDDSDICSSVIGKKSRIGAGSSVTGAIVGEGCTVGENCIVSEDCVIGDDSRIADGTVLGRGERIPARSSVGTRGGRKMFLMDENIFVDDGLCIFEAENCYEKILRLSKAVSVAFAINEKMGVSICVVGSKNALHLKNVFVSGLQGEGVCILECPEGNQALSAFAATKLETDVVVYFSCENAKVFVSFFGGDGKRIDDETERKISKAYSCADTVFDKAYEENLPLCEPSVLPLAQMYLFSLSRFAKRLTRHSGFEGMEIYVSYRDENDKASAFALLSLLERMGCSIKNRSDRDVINLTVSGGGTRASLRYGNTILDHEHICAVVMNNKEILGVENIFVDKNAPSALKKLQDKNAVYLPHKAENLIFSDAAFALVAILSVLALRKQSPDVMITEIPPFEIFVDEYMADVNRAETAERLSKMYSDSKDTDTDGIRLCLADGNVTVIPNRARGFKIIAEAQNMEAAKELSLKIGDIIKGKE